MNKEMKILLGMVMIVVAGSLTLIYSQSKSDFAGKPDGPPPGAFGHGHGPDAFARLDLTEQQKQQIDVIRENSFSASHEAMTKVRAADEQLRMMVDSGSFSVEKAAPLVKAKADAMAEVELARLAADAEIQKLLTTDQKTQLAEERERRPPPPPGVGFAPPPPAQ